MGEQKVSVNSVSFLLLRRFGICSHTVPTVQLPYNGIQTDLSRLRIQIFFCLPWRDSAYFARAYPLSQLHDHTQTHHTRQDSSGRVISPKHRPQPDNTQHSQETDIHALGGIRTRNSNTREAAYLRLRPRGHWDRLQTCPV